MLLGAVGNWSPLIFHHSNVLQRESLDTRVRKVFLYHPVNVVVVVYVRLRGPGARNQLWVDKPAVLILLELFLRDGVVAPAQPVEHQTCVVNWDAHIAGVGLRAGRDPCSAEDRHHPAGARTRGDPAVRQLAGRNGEHGGGRVLEATGQRANDPAPWTDSARGRVRSVGVTVIRARLLQGAVGVRITKGPVRVLSQRAVQEARVARII